MYIYGYPLVYALRETAGFTGGHSSLPVSAPFNQFGYARELLGPETTFVSPNNDTLYVLAALDLRPGPLVLHGPDTADRYYVLQFVDAWTNNFAYIGRRATGTAEREFLLVGPDDRSEGDDVVCAPTGIVTVVGRLQIDGDADAPAVHALQDQFTLRPLRDDHGPPPGVPTPDPEVGEDLAWWETFRVQLAAFPPPPGDAPFVETAATLGLTAPESPYVDPDPALAADLMAGQAAGQERIEELAKGGDTPASGWTSAMHYFDYNLDHLGIGTIDAPEWRIQDRRMAYTMRAVAARAGLYGNHGYEANYEIVYVDADGQQLNGAHRYELRLDRLPPVDAFWSLTMYNVPRFLLVSNPIGRYSIGDRTPGLHTAPDGSLTIVMQRDEPGDPERRANWLPTPSGPFRPLLRIYEPDEAIFDGTYELPPITVTSGETP